MYSTCLFCSRDLERNEVIESFPVGRRLAFDAVKGRLWVVCRVCRRWNLTPLEERWEAIEEAERRFRDTRVRASTGEIGLARLPEGLELIRVGAPLRPEMAVWRYGEAFGRRRRQYLVRGGLLLGVGAMGLLGGLWAGTGVLLAWQGFQAVRSVAEHGANGTIVARWRDEAGARHRLRRGDMAKSMLRLGDDGNFGLSLALESGQHILQGEQAIGVARQFLPAINRAGGTPEEIRRALGRLESAESPEKFLRETARRGERLTRTGSARDLSGTDDPRDAASGWGLLALATSLGLAMEMALNEERERRALEGELGLLEQEWREAEEIGAIADNLLLPEPIERALAALREKL